MNFYHTKNSGFVALISTIVISSVLLVLMVTTSSSGFFARADAMGSENKRISLGLSESCISQALVKVAQDYFYDFTLDPAYQIIPYNTSESGVRVSVGSDHCFITSVSYGAENPLTHRKEATITTQAEYNGSFSNFSTKATIQNPSASTVLPPPTCTLQASPASVPAGKPITVQWSASTNATAFSLTPTPSPAVSNPAEAQSGTRTYTAAGSGTITYTGIALNSAGSPSAPCTASVNVTLPPPSPACADSVMMLDRTGSMDPSGPANYLPDEQAAANALFDLYDDLVPPPKSALGVFGAISASSPYNAAIVQGLTTVYSTLYSAVTTGLASANGGTNLASAINVGNAELNSAAHIIDPSTGKYPKKVLILVSDGHATYPSGSAMTDATNAANAAKTLTTFTDPATTSIFTIHFGSAGTNHADQDYLATLATNSANDHFTGGAGDSGFLSPTITALPNEWGSPLNATSSNDVYTISNNDDDDQQYRDFNFPTIPVGATIKGIEVTLEAFSGYVPGATALWNDTFGTGGDSNDINNWDEEGSDNDNTTLARQSQMSGEDTASSNGGRFAKIDAGEWICHTVSATGYTSLSLTYLWRGDADAEDNESAVVEYRSGGSCTSATWSTATTHELDDGNNGIAEAWSGLQTVSLPDDLNGFVRFRNPASAPGSEHFRVDNVSVSGTTASSGCELQARIGDAGDMSSRKTVVLTSVETTFPPLGGPLDDWDNVNWSSGDFTNANFRLEVRNNDPGSSCADAATTYLDHVQAKVYYSSNTVDPVAENTDGDHFFIAPNSSDMAGVFTTIGGLVCPALAPACSNIIDDDGDSLTDINDPACHTDDDASNPATYDASDNDEWSTPSIPPPPPTPPPPPIIDISSWQEDPILVTP